MNRRHLLQILILLAGFFLFLLLEASGGAGQRLDEEIVRNFRDWRALHPQATGLVILFTHLGGAPALLTFAALGTACLLWRRQPRNAILLALAVIGGRVGVETIKLAIDRPRPSIDAHPVAVFSQSFPSGHAANSMITYLALAVFCAPEHWRRPAVISAFVLALMIGATRPMLGVHWPSDVLAGWIYGAALVTGLAWATRRRTSA